LTDAALVAAASVPPELPAHPVRAMAAVAPVSTDTDRREKASDLAISEPLCEFAPLRDDVSQCHSR
jgi:hypothetical protein